ncbi:MAG: hypothetical protein CVV02_15160 [Firmicutes bacterium HGW-Firmicutes-7]|nr:MAG: hypothetical protein CVV02_15160 [Firmicutes bacterium HGW-Firmicutes-7]
MATQTTNIGLTKDDPNENYNIEKINANLDIIDQAMGNRVEKVDGKGLSTNDYTTEEKEKLAGAASQSSVDTVTTQLSSIKYLQNTGTANAIAINKLGFTLITGNYVEWQQTAANTGAVTINATETGVKSLRGADGTVLGSGDLEPGFYRGIYDATNDFFVLAPRGEGAKINALIAEYQIEAGNTINAGDLVEFINNKANPVSRKIEERVIGKNLIAMTSQVNAVTIDDTRVLVTYLGSSSYLYALVLIVSETSITKGGILTCDTAAGIATVGLTLISTNKAILAFDSSVGGGQGMVLTVNTTTNAVTKGSTIQITGGRMYELVITKVTTDKALVVYRDGLNSNYTTSLILAASGTTLGAWYTLVIEAVASTPGDVILFNTNKLLLMYQTKAVVLTVNTVSNTISKGTAYTITGVTAIKPQFCSLVAISATKVLLLVCNSQNGYYTTALLLAISGNVITPQTTLVVAATSFNNGAVLSSVLMDIDKVLITHSNSNVLAVLSIGDTTVTKDLETSLLTTPHWGKLAAIATNRTIAVYKQTNDTLEASYIEYSKRAHGLALQNGTSSQIKKFYDWR